MFVMLNVGKQAIDVFHTIHRQNALRIRYAHRSDDRVRLFEPDGRGTTTCRTWGEMKRAALSYAEALRDRDPELYYALTYRDAIIGRLIVEGCANTGDAELARCLDPCVCGPALIRMAKRLRRAHKLSIDDINPKKAEAA